MSSTTATPTDVPSGNPEKLQTPEESGFSQNIQYDESANIEMSEARQNWKNSRWKRKVNFDENEKSDWWFASTAIPLLAASLGPLANVLSIAALVTFWRENVFIDDKFVPDFQGVPFRDPLWCYWLNVASLIFGFLGNLFLLLNFTQRIRYIIALPVTIIFWYLSTGFNKLMAITACMHIYAPPVRPYETYTQGFWYAIAAAALYLVCSMILMINMLGYFLAHYPDTFNLTDAQRTLILQTMLFFIWLAGGAAIFARIETDDGESGWDFADALYFCDVTILTVGFGDLYPTNNIGRGLVFPYSVGGIIMLGLVISSIYKFMRQLGEENIVHKHLKRARERTISRTVTNSFDLRQREHEVHHLVRRRNLHAGDISAPLGGRAYRTVMSSTARRVTSITPVQNRLIRKPRLILMREEKDRFEAMRSIQRSTSKFKKWYALTFSIFAFGILWCVGAIVFWEAEKHAQGMTYFQALYFCYVSLLTIGYGDLSPKSNAGRCFFVAWSLIAVPTMTILVSDMGDTVVEKFKNWSSQLADFTVLPKEGIWRSFLDKHPWLLNWIQTRLASRAAKKRLKKGFATMDPSEGNPENGEEIDAEEEEDLRATTNPTIPSLAVEAEQDAAGHVPTSFSLSRRLALSIRRVAADLRLPKTKKYTYEEWVEFTRLIRFTKSTAGERGEGVLQEEEEEGLVEWDWIGDDSPLLSGLGESGWLLQSLCESLVRLEKRKEAEKKKKEKEKALFRLDPLKEKSEDGTEKDKDEDKEKEKDIGMQEARGSGIEETDEIREERKDAQNQVLVSGANGKGPD
ncbi:voltage-gated potassium channel [Lindgomyces ingoldianus]|uniref:Voltage-gated potassium channel n=1 Tax=Lindgomyces ingoldianus TaxID=673940 RepID=A0ACB6R0S9_9PLEO|nr:voltage-gated potassium channel [Lindgomyces ingoldianus]KAF2472878.1 voltage-gated potassium channel [Lindgomyces ingoldianus]